METFGLVVSNFLSLQIKLLTLYGLLFYKCLSVSIGSRMIVKIMKASVLSSAEDEGGGVGKGSNSNAPCVLEEVAHLP